MFRQFVRIGGNTRGPALPSFHQCWKKHSVALIFWIYYQQSYSFWRDGSQTPNTTFVFLSSLSPPLAHPARCSLILLLFFFFLVFFPCVFAYQKKYRRQRANTHSSSSRSREQKQQQQQRSRRGRQSSVFQFLLR